MKRIAQLILLLCVAVACRKEKIVEVEKPVYITETHHWNPVSDFENIPSYKNVGNASYIGNGQIVFNCEGKYSIYDSTTNAYRFGTEVLSSEIQKTPLIQSKFFLSCSNYNSYIFIVPTKRLSNGWAAGSQFYFPMKTIDPTFINFNFYEINWWQHSEIISTTKNKILISYKDSLNRPSILLTQLIINDWSIYPGYDKVDSLYTKKISFPYPNYASGTRGVIGENLFFWMQLRGTYRINYNNDTIFLGNYNLIDLFETNGKFYSITDEAGIKLKESSDSGATWQDKVINLPSIFGSLNYFNMDGRVFATYNSQIFEIVLGSANLTTKEINNDGLTGNVITSVNKCNNKIIVSTKSGVYYCNYSEFYQYK